VQIRVLVARTSFPGSANQGTTQEPSKEISEFEGHLLQIYHCV